MDWDPRFFERSPMLAAFAQHAASFASHSDWPSRECLQQMLDRQQICNKAGIPLRLVCDAGAYEPRIRESGEMHCRERDWHDFFNLLVWLTYPKAKAALNDVQSAALDTQHDRPNGRSQRGARRDALTVFDENGAIVASSDPTLLDDLYAFRWKRLFVERREEVNAAMRVLIFGHALLEKALHPFVGMTAHAILLDVSHEFVRLDSAAQANAIDEKLAVIIPNVTTARDFSPLPVLGVPGWWCENEDAGFYDNTGYFRVGRRNSLFLNALRSTRDLTV